MDAYVINLKKREDRWKQIQHDFRNTGLHLIRFDAIEDKNGGVGCTRSHLALVEYAKKKKLPYILVIEDDCVPTPEFTKYWGHVRKYIHHHVSEWDVFNGGPITVYKGTVRPLTKHFYSTNSTLGGHFNIYNQRAYDKLLSWENLPQAPEKRPIIDYWISWPNLTLTTYGIAPFIAIQRPGYSNLENKNKNLLHQFQAVETRILSILNSVL